ncbi:MAG: NAD(P)-dependent oxidoreductase [Acidimicrobiaceae bacterium]|nr:NAD(P)-dependent oxidoreductase [Acidimicrobiaceae bacterium]|tara:strand:- start:687 stop:2147 length:1461 start_codon:yes stop_codon:yes gene_type:complete
MPESELIAVTGSTGYVGGRLVPKLLDEGYSVRCVTRSTGSLQDRDWTKDVEIVVANLEEKDEVKVALEGSDRAFYLVHSMSATRNFAVAEQQMAQNFVDVSDEIGLKQLIYLGGLGADNTEKSTHLQSRQEVGRILASGSTPLTELRAAVIIGSGSASFEMLRSLVEVLPFMVVPKWVTKTKCQPISIGNVLENLLHVLGRESAFNRIFEIGGPEVVSYREMMDMYAEVAGLRRRVILPVPVLTPRLSSHWVNLVSPLPFTLARALIDSLTTDVVVQEEGNEAIPGSKPDKLEDAIGKAVTLVKEMEIPTRWSDTSAFKDPARPEPSDPEWAGGKVLVDRRSLTTPVDHKSVVETVTSVGGDTGWFAFNWIWAIRGFVDELLGGVGLRRGRRHPKDLRVGDTVDFFKVTLVTKSRLRLLAEMKVPGHAWLEWTVKETESGTIVQQQALFVPKGLIGRVYWYVLLPAHILIWKRMLQNLVRTAESKT